MGIVNALGTSKVDVLRGLLAADRSGMVPYTRLLTGRSTVVGKVRVPLQPVPESLANLDCRNNRLLATALVQIAPAVAELRETLGPERIAVVIGTSTSGIAEGEDAIEALATTGRMPSTFHYARQEIGMASEFVARYLGLTGVRF